jgi:large exoprotein involved in heme utilization and adhesion
LLLTGIYSGTAFTGAGGNVTLNVADTLSLLNGGVIGAGAGDGNITITAGNLLVDGQGRPTGISSSAGRTRAGRTGAGGDVTLNVADTLSLLNGGQIASRTYGSGDAGDITITARNLLVDGQGYFLPGYYLGEEYISLYLFTGIFSDAAGGSTGAGGDVNLNVADTLSLLNGGQIGARSNGTGDAGHITVTAGRAVTIAGGVTTADGFAPSGLYVSAHATGYAGDLTLTTPSLTLADGGGIFAQSDLTTGGNILVNAAYLKLFDGSEISSSVAGSELSDGGNITLNSTNVVALNGSRITARANQGRGGNILVNAEVFLHDAARVDEVLNASSQVAGNDGTVQNNAPTTNISGSLTALPARYLNAADQLSRRCGANDPEDRSSFTVQGRGALPLGPDEPATTSATGCAPLALASIAPPASTPAATPATAISGFGDQ